MTSVNPIFAPGFKTTPWWWEAAEPPGRDAILPDSAGRRKAEKMIDDAIAAGIETTELGTFIYDPTPGLMRSVKFDATMNVGTLKRATHFAITRVTPE